MSKISKNPKHVQKVLRIRPDLADWITRKADELGVKQSSLADEAFSDLRTKYELLKNKVSIPS